MTEDSQQDAELPADFAGPQIPTRFGTIVKWGGLLVALILVFVLISLLRSIYTDILWFDALGFKSVFLKILFTRIVLFIIGAAFVAALLGTSLYFSHRLSRGPETLPLPPDVMDVLKKATVWGTVAVVIILSIIFGAVLASKWELFLRFTNAISFGETDPVYNKDVSFYVFTLPAYSFLQGWLLGAGIVVLLATLTSYFVNFYLRGISFNLTTGLKVQISIIGALVLFVVGWGHWLDRWGLVLSENGAIFGAAYADLHARQPALFILTIIAVASGVLMLVNAYLKGMRLLIGAVALWIVLFIVLNAVWPGLVQNFRVTPNEFAKESQYIERNIEFTRRGFDLNRITETFYPAETSVTAELIRQNPQTINNIRLWDYRPLTDVFKQIQLIRPYYDFRGADVDRYTINGEYRQVLLAAREVAPEKLTDEAQTWVNEKLIYTHGIGLAMSPVTEFTTEGRPEFFAKDIPPNGQIPIASSDSSGEPDILVNNPRIYYGENTLDYVLVNTNTEELDYQTGEGDLFRTNYSGTGGVRIGSYLRRLAYAWQFGDVNILISGEITSDSLLQYRRDIQERVSTAAPFLLLDEDPYLVAAEGQLFWIQDAYTKSDNYPYSDLYVDPLADPLEPAVSFNYLRNSVKVVVDAFNGILSFYIWDTSDPIVQTYAKIFPDLFVDREEMPESLQEHVRYPQDLFTIQARQYVRYHMQDAQDFYNNEDLWAFANEKFGQADTLKTVEPYYIIMKFEDEEREEFVQLLPYTPNDRQNLVGWLAARSDGENYGKLVAFNFPKDRQVDGPEQVEARIDNDQDISAWFTLRCAEGSSCIRGNLLVIPVGNSIIYAEPVYIQAEGLTRFPQLKRVILATGERVVMEDTLNEALVALTAGVAAGPDEPVDGQATATDVPDTGEPLTGSSEIQAELESLTDTLQEFQDNLSQLQEALERLKLLTGAE